MFKLTILFITEDISYIFQVKNRAEPFKRVMHSTLHAHKDLINKNQPQQCLVYCRHILLA